MRQYGIGYQGSKSQIAEDIINVLPAGKRLVDLFGGGFAISHCALLSGKWDAVWYNDINPLLPKLIQDAIDGKYSYERFIPEWISREDFFARKDSDGYVKYCWSFSCNGIDYLYGKDKEEFKRFCHEWVINDQPIPGLENLRSDYPCEPKYFDKRRKELKKIADQCRIDRIRLQHLEQIERLAHLERIQRLDRRGGLTVKDQLTMTMMDYREYEYQDGDIVYCDIPYPNCVEMSKNKNYETNFDHGAFYQWAISRQFPVYFSSYRLGSVLWEKDKYITKAGQGNGSIRREVLYCVDNDFVPPKKYTQGWLFI